MSKSYFLITICTKSRKCTFADPDDPERLTQPGKIAHFCWSDIPNHFSDVDIDEFVVMPNHIHGILLFSRYVEVKQKFASAKSGSLITVIKSFKSAVTKKINELESYQDYIVWQRGFHDVRIRNVHQLNIYRQYIHQNQQSWIMQNIQGEK